MKTTYKSLIFLLGIASTCFAFNSAHAFVSGGFYTPDQGFYTKGAISYVRSVDRAEYEGTPSNQFTYIDSVFYKGTGRRFDGDVGLNAAIGYRFSPMFRVEVEGGWFKNQLNAKNIGIDFKTRFESKSLMGNILIDIPTRMNATPYFGGGYGLIHIKTDNDYESILPTVGIGTYGASEQVKGGQAIAGIAFKVRHNLELLMEYKLLFTEDAEFDAPDIGGNGAFLEKYGYDMTHHFGVGFRYSF